jgi:hypothetical protein
MDLVAYWPKVNKLKRSQCLVALILYFETDLKGVCWLHVWGSEVDIYDYVTLRLFLPFWLHLSVLQALVRKFFNHHYVSFCTVDDIDLVKACFLSLIFPVAVAECSLHW